MHDALQLHPTPQGTSSCSASSQRPTPRKFSKNPKKYGLTAENPPPPQKQTHERLITFLIKKHVKYVHPSHPIPASDFLLSSRQEEVPPKQSIDINIVSRTPNNTDWITRMHESLQLHPTHKHILGSECSASLQQSTPRKFSQTQNRNPRRTPPPPT